MLPECVNAAAGTRPLQLRRFRCAGIAIALTLGAACVDATAVTSEPDIESMELRLDGSLVLTVRTSGGMHGPGLQLQRNTDRQLEAVFRDDAGRAVALESDFELRVEVGNAAIARYDREAPKRGVLRGLTAGTTTARVSLMHLSQGHADFPPVTVTLGVIP